MYMDSGEERLKALGERFIPLFSTPHHNPCLLGLAWKRSNENQGGQPTYATLHLRRVQAGAEARLHIDQQHRYFLLNHLHLVRRHRSSRPLPDAQQPPATADCMHLQHGMRSQLIHACDATGSLQLALSNGGPPTAVWGWILVACMTLTVGLSMAEIVSSLPTSGGPYFWCAWLFSCKHLSCIT